jgi:outer membrane protein OmpA-like peptidoglycan-associated protein
MKYALYIIICFFTLNVNAQKQSAKKPSFVDLHAFYNDFNTAQTMKSNSLGKVLNNKLWNPLSNMQVGLGVSYLKGVTSKIDAIASVDATYFDYLYQSGATHGSSEFLLASQAALNVKLLTDKHPVVPYLTGGIGFSMYQHNTGFYVPVGAGLQFKLFADALVFANAQYRFALSNIVNDHYYYSVGIGVPIAKPKTLPLKPIVETAPNVALPTQVKSVAKNIKIYVTDEATGYALPHVKITLTAANGNKLNETTDTNGFVTFNEMAADNYSITGVLNNINCTPKNIVTTDFETTAPDLKINLSHNDPRFTLAGNVYNKATKQPEGNVDVTATNTTLNTSTAQLSNTNDGSFNLQLDANSDFTIVGKKASYLSNIEKATTKGLNRSTTLYLKLELDVQEITASKNIVLNNINFESGKTNFTESSSTDLNLLIQFLKDNKNLTLEIQGHTDNSGTVAGNLKLSQARANSIVVYLIKNNISKERLIAKGYGSSKPIADNTTAQGKAQNRRVEMKLIQ